MRAAWWWIDRWRKSTAYTDMTLAEQGAYRNLLDELWTRDGLLPNDERILGRASGDPVEWPAVRDKVMAHFILSDGGWRNETHDQIAKESRYRADKQKRYRERKGNVTGNVTQSPSPSPSKDQPSRIESLTEPTPPTPLNGGRPDAEVRQRLHRKRKREAGLDTLDVLGNRVWIDAFNASMDCKLTYTPSNLQAVQRARDHGYTLEQAKQTFQSVYEQSTPSAVWCAKNNWDFEYLIRPPYKSRSTGATVQGVIDKVLNDLASGRTTDAGTAQQVR